MAKLNEEQLKALLVAAQTLGINPNELKPSNPWEFQGPRAESIQAAVAQQNPAIAAKWRLEAGQSVSLGAAAARAGIGVMTNAQHQELLELDPDYAAGAQEAQSRREAEILASMEEGASKLAEARQKQQVAFKNTTGIAQTGEHNQAFLKRIGGQQGLNMPARRLTGN